MLGPMADRAVRERMGEVTYRVFWGHFWRMPESH